MTAISATDAALEGFRITRERPRVVMGWAIFLLITNLIGALITLALPEEARGALAKIASQEAPDPRELLDAMSAVAPLLLVGLVVQRTMDAAVYRLMLRPEENKFAYLRLGVQEMRLTVLRLIFVVLAIVYIAVVQFGIVILSFTASALGQAASLFVASVAELVSWGVFLVLAVRLSLASVISFDSGKLAVFASWNATRGLFWRILGIQLLALCCVAVLGILVFVIFSSVSGAVLILNGGSLADVSKIIQPEEVTAQTYLNPFVLAYTLIGVLFTTIYSAVVAAPGAYIYKNLKAREAAA
jgi:hypothetical protein